MVLAEDSQAAMRPLGTLLKELDLTQTRGLKLVPADGRALGPRGGYRWRRGFTSVLRRPGGAPCNAYVREDHLLEALPGLLQRSGGLVEQDIRGELVDQVREQGQQIEYVVLRGQRLLHANGVGRYGGRGQVRCWMRLSVTCMRYLGTGLPSNHDQKS